MAFFRQSLAEHFVDRYIHTWTVSLLLFLSLITWLLALAVTSKDVTSQPVQASCWCPAQFERSQVEYANRFCAAWYHELSNSADWSSHYANMFAEHPPRPRNFNDYANIQGRTSSLNDSPRDSFYALIIPFVLFIFALLLKLPHIVYRQMLTFAPLNIEKILEAAVRSQNLRKSSKLQVTTDLVTSAASTLKVSSNRATFMFLMYKFTSSLILLLESITLGIKILYPLYESVREDEGFDSRKSEILPCFFKIRALTNVHDYTVQCLFTRSPKSKVFLFALQALFTGLIIYLLVLFVVSVVSLLTWLSKLTFDTCRRQVKANSSLPVDAYLLLHFCQDNVGPLVTQDLAQSKSWPQETGVDNLVLENVEIAVDGQNDEDMEGAESEKEKMDTGKERMENDFGEVEDLDV